MKFGRYRKLHMTGIGGIGMSSIAEVLKLQGFDISGSDLRLSEVTERLASLGIRISKGHSPVNIGDAEVLVYSSACPHDNPELIEAQKRKIPCIRRAEMLAELMRMKFGIGIAGTHGKTTTTTMAGAILIRAGLDPTVIVGGISPLFGSNARIGGGEYLVVEADEFDRTFLQLTPTIAVITNLELEHLDCYKDMDDLTSAFLQFAGKVPFYGTVILCIDDQGVQSLIQSVMRPVLTYGLNPQSDLQAINIYHAETRANFEVILRGEKLGRVEISVPGLHNVRNALAAIAIALELEVPFDDIQKGLKDFTGVKRRFQKICEVNNVLVYDDYAHHHSEVKATLEAARQVFKRKTIAVFQPHLYSRTRDFHQEFGRAFHQADVLLVTPIYPAREKPIAGITGELIVTSARESGHSNAYYIEQNELITAKISEHLEPGSLLITMGAGDIWRYGRMICSEGE